MHDVPLPEPLGDSALVARFGVAADAATMERVRSAERILAAEPIPGVVDFAPTFATIAVFFDPLRTDPAEVAAAFGDRLARAGDAPSPEPRSVVVPVAYGGDDGPDLDAVAAGTGLSPADVVAIHRGVEHVVGMIGFAPGFPYLLGLPERLALPRRAVPRGTVPAGSVAIADAQTGIYPQASPAGWHVIGRTPSRLFDPARRQPSLLRPGDRVRFEAVGAIAPDPAPVPSAPDRTGAGILVRVCPGPAAVQDRGRIGWRRAGVGPGGAADPVALEVGNLLVGNRPDAAAIEFALAGPTLAFATGRWVAVTGTAAAARVRGSQGAIAVPAWQAVWVPAGSTLEIDGSADRGTARGVVAVSGGIAVPPVLGSRATDARARFGGLGGRFLRPGDVIPCGAPTGPVPADPGRVCVGNRSTAGDFPPRGGAGAATLRIVAGPEHGIFPPEARRTLVEETFTVSRASDRMGARLAGARLPAPAGILSEALVAGTVQVPPGGEPILLGADHPVTGGYARIAVVATVDLPLVGRLAPGAAVRFAWIDLAEARSLARRQGEALGRVRRGAEEAP